MTFFTHADAKATICPIARITGEEKPKSKCQGEACILWRWKDMAANDPRFLGAITRVQMELMEAERKANPDTKKTQGSFAKEATAKVSASPWMFAFMTDKDRGFCGLGGRPVL